MSVFGVNAMIYGHVHLSPSSIGQAEFVVKARVSIVILFCFNKVRIKGKNYLKEKCCWLFNSNYLIQHIQLLVCGTTQLGSRVNDEWVKLITKKT